MDGMTDTELPNSDSVVLYAKPNQILDDQPGKVDGSAFVWKGRGEGLSVNWLEYFGPDRAISIQQIRQVIRITLRPNGRFAVLGVAAAKQAVIAGGGSSPEVTSSPAPGDPSHASIGRYTIEDFQVAVELKALVSQQGVFLARA